MQAVYSDSVIESQSTLDTLFSSSAGRREHLPRENTFDTKRLRTTLGEGRGIGGGACIADLLLRYPSRSSTRLV